MPSKEQLHHHDKVSSKKPPPQPAAEDLAALIQQQTHSAAIIQRGRHNPRSLTQHDLLHLQGTIGNQAVGRILAQTAEHVTQVKSDSYGTPSTPDRSGPAQEALAGQAEPDQQRSPETPRTRAVQVTAVIRKGSNTPVTHLGRFIPKPDSIVARQQVAPTGAPTVHAGGGNDCTPGTEALDWNVVDDGANWRANVVALNVSGDIHITDWPSAPTSMTVPNTPNPVDGGNINNTAGSPNHWQAAIDDMADYDTAGVGGAGANWHSTAASQAHEWAHWNEDYLADCLPSANWAQANRDIDQITVAKAAHADAAAARTALEPQVTARFNSFVQAATNRWNAIINGTDKPGKGGRGYTAGLRVLNGLIQSVRAYASSKGWAGLSTGAKTAIGAGGGALVGAGIGGLVGGPLGAAVGAGIGGLIGGVAGFFS